jgi:hypothetical protein
MMRNEIIVKTIIIIKDASNRIPCITASAAGISVEKTRVEAATVINNGDTTMVSQKLQRFNI